MEIPKAEGYFTNDGGLFGPIGGLFGIFGPNRKEYLHVTFNNGKWQALKIVGDINVPRGKVSFRTVGHLDDIQNLTQAELQIRTETWNEDGFSWMEGVSVRFDTTSDKWFINAFGGSFSLSRVHESEALNAAQNPDNQ